MEQKKSWQQLESESSRARQKKKKLKNPALDLSNFREMLIKLNSLHVSGVPGVSGQQTNSDRIFADSAAPIP